MECSVRAPSCHEFSVFEHEGDEHVHLVGAALTVLATRTSCSLPSCSLIQALLTLRSVVAARAIPFSMASSKLSSEVELRSVSLATVSAFLLSAFPLIR